MARRPNILLIYTDQQRFDTIAALGNDAIATPNLDRLAAEGVAFTHATTPSPVCAPARWSLHSGQYPSTHRCYSNHHPGVRPPTNLPAVLREAGYRTGLIGKNHSFLEPEDVDVWGQPQTSETAAREARQSLLREHPRLVRRPMPGGVEADPEKAKTDAALQFIDSSGGRPFFLWLSYLNPHTPYAVPEPYFSMYQSAVMPEPVVEPEGLAPAGKPFRQIFHQRNNDAIMAFSPEEIMLMRRVYYGMISLVDAEIGRVLSFLDARGMAENTLLVFTSDHGDYQGDHGLITKSPALYDCLVRVPFIARWPARIADRGRRDPRLVSHVDLLPTFAAAAQMPCPPQAEGVNLLPHLTDPDTNEIRPAAFSEYGIPGRPYDEATLAAAGLAKTPITNPGNDRIPWEGNPVTLAGRIQMVRTHHWKLVEEPGGTNELYDLTTDPHELVNLWGLAQHLDTQAKLEAILQSYRTSLASHDKALRRQ